jgi:hypothetical protein
VSSRGEGVGIVSVDSVLPNVDIDGSDRGPGEIDKVFVLIGESLVCVKGDVFIPVMIV